MDEKVESLKEIISQAYELNHDIKQPLQIFSGYLEMMMSDVGNDEQYQKPLMKMSKQIKTITEIVKKQQSILSISKL